MNDALNQPKYLRLWNLSSVFLGRKLFCMGVYIFQQEKRALLAKTEPKVSQRAHLVHLQWSTRLCESERH